jgi:hypothetical protein
MQFYARMSPLRAVRDLRLFLAQRERHELWFLIAAIAITAFFIYGFAKDSHVEKVYRPNIVYVQQWTLDRTDDQIKAQQKIDEAKRVIEQRKTEAEQAKNRAEFKKIDDALNKWGI